jgi:hypothetical protein
LRTCRGFHGEWMVQWSGLASTDTRGPFVTFPAMSSCIYNRSPNGRS